MKAVVITSQNDLSLEGLIKKKKKNWIEGSKNTS